MRLKRLWIEDFKNLKNFEIDFETKDGITVLIGNNASGKSNVLEAISAIFAKLYNPKVKLKKDFNYEIEYSIEIKDSPKDISKDIGIKIKYENKKYLCYIKLNFKDSEYEKTTIKDIRENRLPDQVIALYSGEETRLWNDYYENFYCDYVNNLKKKKDSTPKLLYINKYVWNIALITLLAEPKSNDFIKKSLDIDQYDDGFDVVFKIDESRYQGYKNNKALDLVRRIATEQKQEKVINTKTLASFDIGNQQIKSKKIFEYLYITSSPTTKNQKVKIDKIITDIKVTLSNSTTTKDLSEGQKKQILLKLALDVLADDNALLLFDEPDAHIHIANKKIIPDALREYEKKRNIVLTTHSPTLAHSFDADKIRYLDKGKIDPQYSERSKIISELTDGYMGVSEQALFLNSNKDILIVEGKTDEDYISQALKVLKKNNPKYKDLEFNFLSLGGTDPDIFKSTVKGLTLKKNQTIIAFFDRDDSGKKCVKGILNKKPQDNFDGEKNGDVHVYLYPKKEDFDTSIFEVEDYFPIDVLRNFVIGESSKDFQSVKTKFNKTKFADKCQEKDFDKSNFDGFKVLFDKIIDLKEGKSNQE